MHIVIVCLYVLGVVVNYAAASTTTGTSSGTSSSTSSSTPAKKNIVDLNFVIAMGIMGFFVAMVTAYALYTYWLRYRKRRAMAKKKKEQEAQQKQLETQQQLEVVVEK